MSDVSIRGQTYQAILQLVDHMVAGHPNRQTEFDIDDESVPIEYYVKLPLDADHRVNLALTTDRAQGYSWVAEISLFDFADWEHYLLTPAGEILHAHGDDRDNQALNQSEADHVLNRLLAVKEQLKAE